MSTNGKSKYVFSANSAAWGRSITQRNNFVNEVLTFLESLSTEEGIRALQEMGAVMGSEAALDSLLSDNAKTAALGFFATGQDVEGIWEAPPKNLPAVPYLIRELSTYLLNCCQPILQEALVNLTLFVLLWEDIGRQLEQVRIQTSILLIPN